MRRRYFVAMAATGAVLSTSGCIGETVIRNIDDFVHIQPESGEVWTLDSLDEADDSVEVGYTVESEYRPFQVFYFTSRATAETYQSYIAGQQSGEQPTGFDKLNTMAVPNDDGVYTATSSDDGGRKTVDIGDETEHYFAVDYSEYGQRLGVETYDDELQASVDMEVVDSGLI
jgi:hypothetical protein